MKILKVLSRFTSSRIFPSLLVLALILLFNVIVQPGFLSVEYRDGRLAGGLITILNRSVPVMILAIGMTLVIATAGIDLSVGTMVAVSGAVAILLIRGGDVMPTAYTSTPLPLVIIITLLTGAAFGLWNGFLVTKLGVPPFIATLILMVTGRGITHVMSDGGNMATSHTPFREIAGGITVSIPNQIWIALFIFLLIWFLTRRTAFGLFVESIGINKSAATYSGIKSNQTLLIVYMLSALCASIVGILTVSTTLVLEPLVTGQNMELSAIVAVVLGGTSLKGGRFSLAGSCIGAIILMALTQTMFFYGVPVEFSLAIQAMVIALIIVVQSPMTRYLITSRFSRKSAKREVSTK